MSVLEYIEETNPPEVRELLTAAHHYLQESLPPFAVCAIKWRIPFYKLNRNFCYLNRHPDHITPLLFARLETRPAARRSAQRRRKIKADSLPRNSLA